MSRKRLTWNRRNADVYTMNQDRTQPAADKYWIGDSSEFGEDVHRPLPDDIALGRNEIGQPNLPQQNYTHKNVDHWGDDGQYDNRVASRRKEAAREVFAKLERKAFQCVRIAEALLPTEDEDVIEDQAFDLMELPDDVVVATLRRLAEASEEDDEDEDEAVEAMLRKMLASEEEDDDEDDSVEATIRRILAEKEEDEDEDEDDAVEAMIRRVIAGEEDDDEDEDDAVEAMLRKILAEEEDDDEDEDKEESVEATIRRILAEKEEDDDEDEDKEESVEATIRRILAEKEDEEDDDDSVEATIRRVLAEQEDEDDEDEVEAMIRTMMEGPEEVEANDEDDYEIELDATMDHLAGADSNDVVLRDLFASTLPKDVRGAKSKKAAKSRGVSSLGGRVKEAAAGGEDIDLSKIWQSDPDISNLF